MLTSAVILTALLGISFGADIESLIEQVYQLGYANNYFAVNLHRELAEAIEGNVFFSPFSVSSVLTMLYKGARGETAEEMKRVLGYTIIDDQSEVFSAFQFYLSYVLGRMNPKVYTINCASAMLIDNTFPVLPEFKSEIRDVFEAYVEDVNMAQESAAAVDRMNTWVKIKTKGNIQCLADSVDPETTVFLASAAYFKGSWKVKFDEEDTKLHPFYNEGLKSNVSNVWMMHAYPSIRYFEDEDEADFTAVELFYEGRDISMVIYLPTELDGLHSLEKYMTASKLAQVRRQMYFMRVHLTMPRFKLEMDRSLTRPLKNLGMTRIFGLRANLTGMIPRGSALCLDDVKHKATIEVNEKGSIAAAVTRSIMTKSMPDLEPDPEFKVDHPFLFALFDTRTDMVLFMGRINNFKNQTA